MSKKIDTVLYVCGKGGHMAQMKRLVANMPQGFDQHQKVLMGSSFKNCTWFTEHFPCNEARDKHSRLKSAMMMIAYVFMATIQVIRIFSKYNVVGVVSTGPGMAVLPSLYARLLGKPVVYFESWSRVYKPAMAGKVMYKIANVFFIQHKTIAVYYPNAIYAGRL